MEEWQRKHIVHNLVDLIYNTICDKPFLTKLQADELLSKGDVEYLESLHTASAATGKMYDILQTRTRGFELLIKHLHNSKQTGACDILLYGYNLHKEEIPKSLETIINEQTNRVLESSVWVQDKYVKLADVLSLTNGYQLDISKIDVQTKNEILSNNFILWNDCIPCKPRNYVRRTLTPKWHVRAEILKSKTDDIFIIQGILRNELAELVKPETAHSSSEIIHSINGKFVLLDVGSEEEVRRLSELANGQNMHHLRWEHQKLVWVQTFGKVKNLQEFVQQDTQSIGEDEVLQLCGKHVCITGDTGMGKTVLLQHLAHVFSDCSKGNPSQFTFYFDFNEFLEEIEKVSEKNRSASMKDAIIIAIAKLTASTKLDIQIFTRILANPEVRIRLFLDGFSQKVPFNLSSDFFSTIRNEMSETNMCVTTRSSNCKQLESLMDVLAVSLNPIVDQGKDILSKSLEDKGFQDSHTLAEYLVDIMVSNDQKISDPLTYMLLEKVYLEKKGNKNEVTLSYFELSKNILEKQLQRVLEDNDFASSVNRDESRFSITMYKHALILIALDLVFPNFTSFFNGILNCNHPISVCIKPLLDLGILYSTESPLDTAARFCNRTAAERLLAEFFVDILGQNKAFPALDLHFKKAFVKFLFEEVLETRKITKRIMKYDLPNISAEVTMYTFVHPQIASFLNTSLTMSKILLQEHRDGFLLQDLIEIKLAKHAITKAIQACVECSYTSVLNLAILISKNIDTNISLIFEDDLIISAATFSNVEFNASIMNLCQNKEIEIQNSEGKVTALQAAIHRGYFHLVQLLKSDEFGRDNYLLHFLVVGSMHDNSKTIADKIDIMEQILKEKPQCIDETMEGETPVFQVHIHEKLIEHILNQNNVNDCNTKGDNILDMFLKRGEEEKIDQETLDRVLIMLREKGFNLKENVVESKMSEIFRYANVGDNTIKILQGASVPFSFNPKEGESLLFHAVRTFQSLDCIKSLIKNGHNISDTNNQGQTILHASVIKENCEVVDYLISISLDTNTSQESILSRVDNEGNTALHVAFLRPPSLRAEEIQDKLLQADPKLLFVKNNAGMTPLKNSLKKSNTLCITSQRLTSSEIKKLINLQIFSEILLNALAKNSHFEEIKNKDIINYQNLVLTLQKKLPRKKLENYLSKIEIDFNGKIQNLRKLPIELKKFANSLQRSECVNLHEEVFLRYRDKEVVKVLNPIQNEELPSYISRTFTVYRSDSQTKHTQAFISEDTLVNNVDDILSRFCYLDSEALGITCCMKSLACKIQSKYTDRVVVFIDILEFLNSAETYFPRENSSIHFLEDRSSFNFLDPFSKFISVSEFSKIVLKSLARNNITKFEIFIDGLGQASSEQLSIAKRIVVSLTGKIKNARVIAGTNPGIFNPFKNQQDICIVKILSFNNTELANFVTITWNNFFEIQEEILESVAHDIVYTRQNLCESLVQLAPCVFFPLHVLEFSPGNCSSGIISDESKTDTSLTDILILCLKCLISKKEINNCKTFEFSEILQCYFPDFLSILKADIKTFEAFSNSVDVLVLQNRYMSNCLEKFSKKFAVAEFFLKYFFETQLYNQRNVLKYIFSVLFSTSTTKSICFDTMEGIGLKIESFNLKCRRFFHSDFIEIINAQIKTKAQYNIPEEVVQSFVENIQPKQLLQILLACLFHNHLFLFGLFYNIFENIKKKDVKAYRYYFCEELKPCFLINVAAAHSSINLVNLLFSFYSEIFQFDLNAYCKKTDSQVLYPLYFALQRGSFEVTEYLFEVLNLKQIYGSGLLHICLHESKNQPMYIISSKKKIIKLLLQKNIELSEEVWNSTKPLLMMNVHVDLMLQLLEEGTNHCVADLKRNNVAHCGALYFDAASFIKLYTKLSNLPHFKDIFLAVNSNNRTPIHEAILRIPSLSLACVKHVIDNTKFEILKFRQDKMEESFFFVDMKHQPKSFQRGFYNKAIEWYLETQNPSMLLDAVTQYGNPVMVAELLTFKQFEKIKGDRLGNNILHLTALYFKPEDFHKEVKLRITRNQNYLFKAKNTEGITPLHLAILNKNVNVETIKLLRLHKIDLHSKYKNGSTILQTAKNNNCNKELVKILEDMQDTSGCKVKYCYRVR